MATSVSLWERAPLRIRHAIVLGFLVLVALAFFWPVTVGNYALIGGDTVQWRGMAQAMFEYEAETGNRALWAPNNFGGMPGFLILYPKEVLQVDAIPAALRNLGWWPFAHFIVLLLGTFLLTYFLSRDTLASALAAVAYGFTTYIPIILAAGHNTKFVAMAFAPWLVLAFVFALRRPPGAGWTHTILGALLFAVALAANLRAEHVQITYYVVFVLGVVWLVEGVSAIRDKAWKPFAFATLSLVIGGVLGALLVAQPYMAVAEYREFTIRAATDGGLDWHYATRWSQGFGELITLLVPHAYGGEGMMYWGSKPFTAGPHYLGPLVLLLAGLALAGVKRRVVIGLGVATGLTILFALGEHFPLLNRPMFNYFPLFSSFRVPETWLAATALAVAVLAGAGLYYLARREATPEAEARKTRFTHVGLAVLAGLLLLVLVGRDALFAFERPGEFDQIVTAASAQFELPESDQRVQQAAASYLGEIRSERRQMFTRDAMRAFLFVLLGGALIVAFRRRLIPAWVLQVGIVLLVMIDLWQVDRRYFNTDHPALRTPTQVQRIIPEYGFDRFIQAQVEVAGGPGHFRTLPLALNPFNDGRTPYFYESVGGYHGAKLAVYQDYIDELIFRPDGRLNEVGLDLMSTRYVVHSRPLPGMRVAFEDAETGLVVLERPQAMPRAWFVDQIEVVESSADVIARLSDPTFDLATTAVVAEEPEGMLQTGPAGDHSVELVRHTPREIVWSVSTDRPRLFVASEVYYPAGWTAFIDRDEVPIIQTNHLLRGVVVPEGRHHLTMRFDPAVHRVSVLITFVSTLFVYLALLLVIGMAWYRRGDHG